MEKFWDPLLNHKCISVSLYAHTVPANIKWNVEELKEEIL